MPRHDSNKDKLSLTDRGINIFEAPFAKVLQVEATYVCRTQRYDERNEIDAGSRRRGNARITINEQDPTSAGHAKQNFRLHVQQATA